MQHRYDGVVAEVEHDGLTADFSVGSWLRTGCYAT